MNSESTKKDDETRETEPTTTGQAETPAAKDDEKSDKKKTTTGNPAPVKDPWDF